MILWSTISTALVKSIADKASEKVIEKILNAKGEPSVENIVKKLPDLFESHLTELINWSFDVPFIGLSKPKNIQSSTIELWISSLVSKLDQPHELISEADLLVGNTHIVLCGAPGAGKTTTLKRIIMRYFIDGYDNLQYDFPILIRFRALADKTTISLAILDLLGIQYDRREIKIDNDRSKFISYVGETPVDIFVPQFLNETRALLILDGLDEAPAEFQNFYQKGIEELALKLNSSKIIYTIRKSKLADIETRFNKYEIRPLNADQIQEISKKWMGNYRSFYKDLKKKPYNDLANRPIFLTLLMLLYTKFHELPIQANEVYRESTYLVIKDWDEHRHIVRKSKYGDFNARQKIRFLAELSYHLTYKVKSQVFSHAILSEIYTQMYSKYNLPYDDIDNVIAEIESHTGIVVETGFNDFEFSHLSIQEYLCAEYLVTLPISADTIKYFYEYPEPLAIAVCLSGDSGQWLSNILLNKTYDFRQYKKAGEDLYSKSVFAFISRLLIESPSFVFSEILGFTILSLFVDDLLSQKIHDLLIKLLDDRWLLTSLNVVLSKYEVIENIGNLDSFKLKLRDNIKNIDPNYKIPICGTLKNTGFDKYHISCRFDGSGISFYKKIK